MNLETLLTAAKDRGASDLLAMVGDAPALRVAGEWVRFDQPPVTKEEMDVLVEHLITPEQREVFDRTRELDFSRPMRPVGRIRCNLHFQRNHMGIVIRLVWPNIPAAADLGIPGTIIKAAETPTGLILISGPTGAGKSTTIAAMVEHINTTRAAHVITIEDPIEFIYQNKKAIIEQREIGADTISFGAALRHVLRQAPDVIILGELRDLESIQIALLAAETGHLVIASVHASNAMGAVMRIVDVFPPSQISQVRLQLSQTLRLIFAQRLVPGREPQSRVLVYETLVDTPAVQNLLRTNEVEQVQNVINSGRQHGMISFAQCIEENASRGRLHPDFVRAAHQHAAAFAGRR